MIADTTPPELRGTAYGVFNFVSGVAMLLASVLAGVLGSIWLGHDFPCRCLLFGRGFNQVE